MKNKTLLFLIASMLIISTSIPVFAQGKGDLKNNTTKIENKIENTNNKIESREEKVQNKEEKNQEKEEKTTQKNGYKTQLNDLKSQIKSEITNTQVVHEQNLSIRKTIKNKMIQVHKKVSDLKNSSSEIDSTKIETLKITLAEIQNNINKLQSLGDSIKSESNKDTTAKAIVEDSALSNEDSKSTLEQKKEQQLTKLKERITHLKNVENLLKERTATLQNINIQIDSLLATI